MRNWRHHKLGETGNHKVGETWEREVGMLESKGAFDEVMAKSSVGLLAASNWL